MKTTTGDTTNRGPQTRLSIFSRFWLLMVLTIATAWPAAGSVVISQIYGGGGNAGATYTHDFVELFNRGNAAVSINGWSVQYAAAVGTTWQVHALPSVSISPGQYFLIQLNSTAAVGSPLPSPDHTGSVNLAAGSGKVALVSSTTPLAGACPPGGGSIVDFVGYGATANCFEGSAPAPTPSATVSVQRGNFGCNDINNNTADFIALAVAPRNSASPINECPSISGFLSQSVQCSDSVTFNPTVTSGNTPITYSWYHGVTLIPSATGPSLTINPASYADVGTYTVLVANNLGATNGASTTLSVFDLLDPIVSVPADIYVCAMGPTVVSFAK